MNTLHTGGPELTATTTTQTRTGFRELAEISKIREIRKGAYVFRAQERQEYVYFLLEGRIKVGTHNPSGKEVMKDVVFEDELFGESAIFSPGMSKDFAIAIKPAKVACIPIEVVQKHLRENRHFASEALEFLGKKVLDQQRRLEALIFLDAKARIVDFLKQVASDKGEMIGFEILVRNFALTHQDIAHMTGTSRQTVTMVLNELKDENLIYIDRRNLLIRDMEKLG